MKEKKARVEDALHATRAAVEEGIVPGGGVALLRTRAAVAQIKGDNPDQDAGIKIVLRALEEPLRQIVANCGDEPSVVINKVSEGQGNFGYNAATGEYGDMVEMGVLDPTKVTRYALQHAASVAGLMLTTDALVAELPKEESGGGMGGMGGGMGGMGGISGGLNGHIGRSPSRCKTKTPLRWGFFCPARFIRTAFAADGACSLRKIPLRGVLGGFRHPRRL